MSSHLFLRQANPICRVLVTWPALAIPIHLIGKAEQHELQATSPFITTGVGEYPIYVPE
jgi:hypothetical protein